MQQNIKQKYKYKNFFTLNFECFTASPVSIHGVVQTGFHISRQNSVLFLRDIFFDEGLQQRCFLRRSLKYFNHFSCNVFSLLYC